MRIIQGMMDEKKWEKFLATAIETTIYHTPGWSRFLIRTFDYRPFHIFAVNDVDDIIGFLPLFIVPNIIHRKELCAVPFAHHAGFLGDPSVINEVLDAAMEIARKKTGGYLSIREGYNHGDLNVRSGFCTHILELSESPEEVWGKLDRGSVRWAINKARKMGVTVRISKEREDIDAFYHMNCLTKKELGVPCHPRIFFRNLMDELPNNTKLYLSEYQGEIIGGGLFEYWGTKALYGYGCANPSTLQMHPYNAFVWKSIEDACLSGYRMFDFGRTSKENAGLMNFKSKWGTKELDLYYSSSLTTSDDMRRSGALVRFGGITIKHMPLSLYQGLSGSFFNLMG